MNSTKSAFGSNWEETLGFSQRHHLSPVLVDAPESEHFTMMQMENKVLVSFNNNRSLYAPRAALHLKAAVDLPEDGPLDERHLADQHRFDPSVFLQFSLQLVTRPSARLFSRGDF
jgi:hypothetical protein